jgi:hypothetical protein
MPEKDSVYRAGWTREQFEAICSLCLKRPARKSNHARLIRPARTEFRFSQPDLPIMNQARAT